MYLYNICVIPINDNCVLFDGWVEKSKLRVACPSAVIFHPAQPSASQLYRLC